MDPDVGRFYELRQRLRRSLGLQQWRRGEPFSPLQEDAWLLLNEVEEILTKLEQVSRLFPEDDQRAEVRSLRHTLAKHQPRWNPVSSGTVA